MADTFPDLDLDLGPAVVIVGPVPPTGPAVALVAAAFADLGVPATMVGVAGLCRRWRRRLPDGQRGPRDRWPGLAGLAGTLSEVLPDRPADLVGVGLGALAALRLALDGGPVRRLVAVDAPALPARMRAALAVEPWYGTRPRDPGVSDPVTPWLRRPDGRAVVRDEDLVPELPAGELARVSRPVLCVNSPGSKLVTGGDAVARLVPTARLVRLRAGEGRARVTASLADLLTTAP